MQQAGAHAREVKFLMHFIGGEDSITLAKTKSYELP